MDKEDYYSYWQRAKTVETVFPDIETITIKGTHSYSCFAGSKENEISIVLKPDNRLFVCIKCLNRTCTDPYFDITPYIKEVVFNGKESHFHFCCNGKDDDEHPQRCDSEIDLTISPTYK
jgi:hypothetical protein